MSPKDLHDLYWLSVAALEVKYDDIGELPSPIPVWTRPLIRGVLRSLDETLLTSEGKVITVTRLAMPDVFASHSAESDGDAELVTTERKSRITRRQIAQMVKLARKIQEMGGLDEIERMVERQKRRKMADITSLVMPDINRSGVN